MKKAEVTVHDRAVIAPALQKAALTGAPAAAMELPDGTIVTGKTSDLLGASAALLLMNKENFPDYTLSIAIAVVSFVLVHYTRLHPILVIVLAGVAGYALY